MPTVVKKRVKLDMTELDRLIADSGRTADEIVDLTANEAVLIAQLHAPVLSGELRDSITKRPGRTLGKRIIRVGAPYGTVIELGSRHRQAQPFFYKAVLQACGNMGRKAQAVFSRKAARRGRK